MRASVIIGIAKKKHGTAFPYHEILCSNGKILLSVDLKKFPWGILEGLKIECRMFAYNLIL